MTGPISQSIGKRVSPPQKLVAFVAALLALGVAGTALLQVWNADLLFSAYWYDPTNPSAPWFGEGAEPWRSLYLYGEAPGLVLAVAAALILILSLRKHSVRVHRGPCAVIVLTLLLGPGLIVNGILKPGWGRPRPVDTVRFGGDHQYREVWRPQGPGGGKSFPCGHCAIAFAVCALISLRRARPWIAWSSAAGGVLFGVVMGVARIAQGGHFVTDVLWSAVITFALIAALDYLLVSHPARAVAPSASVGPEGPP